MATTSTTGQSFASTQGQFNQQSTDPNFKTSEQNKQNERELKKLKCLAEGGKWDEATGTCIFTPGQQLVQKASEPPQAPPQPIVAGSFNAARGGFVADDGRFFPTSNPNFRPNPTPDKQTRFNKDGTVTITGADQKSVTLTPEEYKTLLGASGNVTNAVQQAQAFPNAEQARIQAIASQQNQLQPNIAGVTLPFEEQNKFENLATTTAAGGGAIFGAKTGAALGTAIAPGIGTLVGGVIGAGVGAVGGAYTKLTIQKRQQVKEANKIFNTAKTNKNEILNMVNAGLLTEGQARELWLEEKQNIALAQRYLKEQTHNDLENFLGNPGDELTAVEAYLALDRAYDIEFENALLNPNPAKIRLLTPQANE